MARGNFNFNTGKNILTNDFWTVEIMDDTETNILQTDHGKLVMPVTSVNFELPSLVHGTLDIGGSANQVRFIKDMKITDKLTISYFDNDIMTVSKYYYKWVKSYKDKTSGKFYRLVNLQDYSRTIIVTKYDSGGERGSVIGKFKFRVIPDESVNSQFDLGSDSSIVETTLGHDVISFNVETF